MKWDKGNVFDLCEINPENISRNYPHDFIKYYDVMFHKVVPLATCFD
jgi:hypothetical protein